MYLTRLIAILKPGLMYQIPLLSHINPLNDQ